MSGRSTRNLATADRFCITDVGSTTTKTILFEKHEGQWRFFRREAPTTVEKPHEDVSIGVLHAIRALERETGRALLEDNTPCVPFLLTSSAGGGLAMVVTGLVSDITADSADRVALGAGAIVLDVLAMDDGRTPYRKIEDLKNLRPDMVLLAGGFDEDALTGPVYLAELLMEADLHSKLNPDAKLAVIYAGNVHARELVKNEMGNRFMLVEVPNLRPSSTEENFEPARAAIHKLFMEHVMSQAPGYETLKTWVSADIEPTPAAFGNILALTSKKLDRKILAIDIGGATTDVFSVVAGGVFRTVSANLGMSYSIRNVVETAGVEAIRSLYHADMSDTEMWNRIGNKHIHPTTLPATHEDVMMEWAAAAAAIREAVKHHIEVMRGHVEVIKDHPDIQDLLNPMTRPKEEVPRPHFESVNEYDLIIGSGGILSHSPREAAAMMLLDALQPTGVVELAVDSAFMFPHLGVLAEVNEELALELFHKLGIVRLGTVYAPGGADPAGVEIKGIPVGPGEVKVLDMGDAEETELVLGAGEEAVKARVRGGVCGMIVDNRARPVVMGATALLKGNYVPPVRDAEPPVDARLERGEIRLRRELAIPGDVFVKPGDTVEPDTVVARSVRQFLRPFFLDVANRLGVPGSEVGQYLKKKVGDEIDLGDMVAKRPGKNVFSPTKFFWSSVRGRIERILPSGTLVVRETPEQAFEYVAVTAAKDLGIAPRELKSYLRVESGQEVDRGQWVAAASNGRVVSASPVRGRVNRIDEQFGIVLIEPLLEEEEVLAWLPGRVEEVTERGCVVANRGVTVTGVWGCGGEGFGQLVLDEARPGCITVTHTAHASLLAGIIEKKGVGLIAGGLDLKDVLDPHPGFTMVVTEGFGPHTIRPEVYDALTSRIGHTVMVDGTTQLRVGVKRPRVILPETPVRT